MMPEKTLAPDEAAIKQDLENMTRRWGELDSSVMFELRAIAPDKAKKPQTAKFAPDWIDEAVHWASNMNALGFNIYVTRNPIKAETSGSAEDDDIAAAFYVWADCDDKEAAGNVHRFDGPKWTFAVTTGRVPHVRAHTYWELEGPCLNLDAWRGLQEGIAAYFGSDDKVVNASRIMRLGGTITYPAKNKTAKGYTSEMATIRTVYDEDRDPVSFEQMMRLFGGIKPKKKEAPADGGFEIDTGIMPTLDRERQVILALSGEEWNNAVWRLVGSYVAKGLTDAEIHSLTDPLTIAPYTVQETRAEVQEMIDRTRRNPEFQREQEFTPNFDHAPAPSSTPVPKDREVGWAVQRADAFTAGFVAPEYIIDGVVQRGRLYTLTAPTGSGKTAVMLYASVAISTGMKFGSKEVEKGDVLFLAGENPDDVRARVIATLKFYGIDAASCNLHFVAGTFSIRKDMQRLREEAERLPNLIMVVIDTFAAYFDGEDENSNAQALDFARVARQLTTFKSKPAVIMPAHPVKGATKGNLAPKGGSSLVNEVDGNLTLWNEGGLLKLHWQVKFRGADFEPLEFELETKTYDELKDAKGRQMPTILAKPVIDERKIQIMRRNLSDEDLLLINIEKHPDRSVADRCEDLLMVNDKGVPKKSSLQGVLMRLKEQKLIKRFRTRWELTKDGKKAVALIRGGEEAQDDDL